MLSRPSSIKIFLLLKPVWLDVLDYIYFFEVWWIVFSLPVIQNLSLFSSSSLFKTHLLMISKMNYILFDHQNALGNLFKNH